MREDTISNREPTCGSSKGGGALGNSRGVDAEGVADSVDFMFPLLDGRRNKEE
jgi:hypothetical protein